MSHEIIIKHCAPTLAGLKIGNLFSYTYQDEALLNRQLKEYNMLLNSKGIYFRILRKKNGIALIYVYRANRVCQILHNSRIQHFLSAHGYINFNLEKCFDVLQLHLESCDFPHEIGIFLGYPLSDVEAFINNKGNNYQHVGYWKVYNNLEQALCTFEKYRKCTRIYNEKFALGYDISRLAVVG